MPQEFLNLLQRHPPLQERRCHRVAQEMRIHPLGDFSFSCRLFDDLLNTAGRVGSGMDRFEEVARTSIPQVRPKLLERDVLSQGDQRKAALLQEKMLTEAAQEVPNSSPSCSTAAFD